MSDNNSTVVIEGKEITYNKVEITEDTKPQDLWEPAKPEELPDNVWIPNRKERRQMMSAKGKKRGLRALGNMFNSAERYAKTNPEFRQEIYKALYENLKVRATEKEEEFKKENIENDGTSQGD